MKESKYFFIVILEFNNVKMRIAYPTNFGARLGRYGFEGKILVVAKRQQKAEKRYKKATITGKKNWMLIVNI
jgi:hypothetical protein